jgi:putative membrane protein
MEQTEPKLSDVLAQKRTDLAVQRTIMAADRSLIAWVRTGLSLIGFGFTIYKALQLLAEEGKALTLRETGPRDIGLILISLGTGSMVFAMLDYWKSMKTLGQEYKCSPWRTALFAAAGVALLGLFLLIMMILRIRIV